VSDASRADASAGVLAVLGVGVGWSRDASVAAVMVEAGKQVPLIAGWDDGLKQQVMLACLRAKFAPGSQLAEELRRTGYRMLVEGNTWGDRTWGAIWMSPQGAAAGAYGIWARDGGQVLAGENWLGRLLMLVRAELDCGVRG
jgi:predicted NAD-dependent protein-ADP-ribosyltransferase YbiA (DUF1768 family)